MEPAYIVFQVERLCADKFSQSVMMSETEFGIFSGSSHSAAQCDIWSRRRMHGYFGLCLTSVTDDGMHMTRLVACHRFKGSHTAQNISNMFSNLVQEFGVENKLVGIVTDNASNMVKAFKQDTCDNNQTTFQVLSDVSEEAGDSEVTRVAINWAELEDEASIAIPPRYGCFAHIIQQVVKDGLDEATTKIKNMLQKCSAIVASMHKSCKAAELLEEKKVPHIHTPNATRWNSKYAMIRSITDAEHRCGGILKQVAELISCSCLSSAELATLSELQDLLAPFLLLQPKIWRLRNSPQVAW